MRRFPALTKLLAVLLLLQWGSAFGHCLRLAAPEGVLHVDLCTPDGLRTVAIPLDDAPAPEDEEHPAAFCPACTGPGAAAIPAPEVTVTPPLVFAQAVDPPPAPSPAPAPTPPRSCQPRAPPTS